VADGGEGVGFIGAVARGEERAEQVGWATVTFGRRGGAGRGISSRAADASRGVATQKCRSVVVGCLSAGVAVSSKLK
jgi:hypothetical protein